MEDESLGLREWEATFLGRLVDPSARASMFTSHPAVKGNEGNRTRSFCELTDHSINSDFVERHASIHVFLIYCAQDSRVS